MDDRGTTLAGRVDAWFRRHPAWMAAATLALAVATAVALLHAGRAEPILYQSF
jgi:hypothetical protein